ncbi:unnamed protein product [Closterium sp. NIES-53]
MAFLSSTMQPAVVVFSASVCLPPVNPFPLTCRITPLSLSHVAHPLSFTLSLILDRLLPSVTSPFFLIAYLYRLSPIAPSPRGPPGGRGAAAARAEARHAAVGAAGVRQAARAWQQGMLQPLPLPQGASPMLTASSPSRSEPHADRFLSLKERAPC